MPRLIREGEIEKLETEVGPFGMGSTQEDEISVAKELYATGKLSLAQFEKAVDRILKTA